MPLKDVTVTIDLVKPAALIGFGKPLILTDKAGGSPFKKYADLAGVAVDFAAGTEAHKAATAIFAQGNPPATVAIAAFDSTGGVEDFVDVLTSVYELDWYFAMITSDVQADIIAVADYIEANKRKMFAARTASMVVLAAILVKDYERTFVTYHSEDAEADKYPEAAWVGSVGALPVGSITWKFKKLTGIQPDDLTATELLAVHDAGGNAYVTKAGDNVTSEGKVVSGEYIDVIMSKDWVQANIEASVQTLLNSTRKIPYTNSGISLIEGVVRGVLQTGFTQGIIADDSDGRPLYSTDFPTREETTAADRAARILKDGKFAFELAGAIQEAEIKGTISV